MDRTFLRQVVGVAVLLAHPAAAEVRTLWQAGPAGHLGAPTTDGRFLSLVDPATGDLTLRDIATGAVRRLTARPPGSSEFAYFSVPSPDGKLVAYAWFNDERFYDLRVAASNGSGVRILVRNEEQGFVQPCAWSPDGRQILTLFFRRDNISQITLVSAADGSVKVLKSLNWAYPNKMSFSPDGRWIAYDDFGSDGAAQRDIFLLAADGSEIKRAVEHPANDVFPLFTPDGRGLLFLSDRGGSTGLWTQPFEGAAYQVEPNMGRALLMGIARDGTLFHATRTGDVDVFAVDWEGAEATRMSGKLRGANSGPEWSPDGKSLAWTARVGAENFGTESRAIVVRDLTTGAEATHAPKLAVLERIRWSPDGMSMLLSGSDRHGQRGLFRYEPAGARLTPLVREPAADTRPLEGAWSADGKSVWFHQAGAIRLLDLASREQREVLRAAEAQHLTVSPDGRWLGYSAGPVVMVMPVDGGEPRQIASLRQGSLDGIEWMRDSAFLLISTPTEPPSLWQVPVGGGAAKRLPWTFARRGGIRLDPSGRRVAFTRGEAVTEIRTVRVPPIAK